MNCLLHIVRKDLRAIKWPLAFQWTAVAVFLGLSVVSPQQLRQPHFGMVAFLLVVTVLMAFLLVGVVVQEDNLVAPSAFWRSRPVPRGTLLGAKLVTTLLVFVVPLLAMTILFDDPVDPTREFLRYLGIAICVVGIAATTSNLRQFLVSGILALSLFTEVLVSGPVPLFTVRSDHPRFPQALGLGTFDTALFFTAILCGSVIEIQYFGTRRALAIGFTAAAFVIGPMLTRF